jgi:hypothetical protein
MDNGLNFSDKDNLTLDSLLSHFSIQARFSISLPILLNRWKNFTIEVENGYEGSLFEYTNSLGGRNLLQSIESSLSIDGQGILRNRLHESDHRFTEVTTAIERPLIRKKDCFSEWWYYRIPSNIIGVLREDLVAEGHL